MRPSIHGCDQKHKQNADPCGKGPGNRSGLDLYLANIFFTLNRYNPKPLVQYEAISNDLDPRSRNPLITGSFHPSNWVVRWPLRSNRAAWSVVLSLEPQSPSSLLAHC